MMLCVHSQEKNKKQNKENKKQNLDDKNQNQKSLKENMKIKCLVDTVTNTILKGSSFMLIAIFSSYTVKSRVLARLV